MQHYDHHWKTELHSFADAITDEIQSTSDGEERHFQLERPLLYSAFIVRKLIEDTAVTDRLKGKALDVVQHSSSRDDEEVFFEAIEGPLPIEDHFDLTEGRKLRISYHDLSSEIIHSEGIAWKAEDHHYNSFAVFSYRNALKRLVVVTVEQYLAMLRSVLEDQPQKWFIRKDLETGKVSHHAE